ncbi:hypothetical protein Tco_0926320 [Tanacetum coccineum]|uniref:Uncharacterized protein n=1 Tax=Tanacetum coccineum TaxID=301880 RepID=A0ABQ5D9H0_9ASTR
MACQSSSEPPSVNGGVPGLMTYLVASPTPGSASISPEGFLSLILLLVVNIATVVVTVVVVVAIVGVVIVVAIMEVKGCEVGMVSDLAMLEGPWEVLWVWFMMFWPRLGCLNSKEVMLLEFLNHEMYQGAL